MKNSKNFAQWVTAFLLGAALIVVYKAFDSLGWILGGAVKLLSILMPFLIGFIIAFLLFGPVNRLETLFQKSKWRFLQKSARVLSVTIVYIV